MIINISSMEITPLNYVPIFHQFEPSWSPEGNAIAFVESSSTNDAVVGFGICVIQIIKDDNSDYQTGKLDCKENIGIVRSQIGRQVEKQLYLFEGPQVSLVC